MQDENVQILSNYLFRSNALGTHKLILNSAYTKRGQENANKKN